MKTARRPPNPAEKLDIGLLMSSLGLMRGGLETQALHLAEGLVARGHRVSVVAGWRPSSDLAGLPARCIKVPCIPANLLPWHLVGRFRPGWPLRVQSLSFALSCQLNRQVRNLIDLADVTMTFLEIETVKFSTWRERRGQPNVSYFPGGIDWGWLRRDRSVMRLAFSQMLADCYRDVAGFHIDGVVLPGVPDEWLQIPYVVQAQVQTLIFVGRLEPNKGIMDLLTIFDLLASEYPELRLRILGDGPLRRVVERRLAGSALSQRVTCLGSVPPSQVRRELQQADLFLFPSHYESLGMAVLEAQAVGVPVVASDIPGIREALGGAGRLVTPDDERLWVEAVGGLIQDQAQRERMSRVGRQRARQFTWGRAVDDLEDYLRLAVERHRR